jgi:hypothetical protein
MSKTTTLAAGQITPADIISIELVQAHETPPTIMINWPPQPTVCVPRHFNEVAAAAMKVLASASTELTRIKANRRL